MPNSHGLVAAGSKKRPFDSLTITDPTYFRLVRLSTRAHTCGCSRPHEPVCSTTALKIPAPPAWSVFRSLTKMRDWKCPATEKSAHPALYFAWAHTVRDGTAGRWLPAATRSVGIAQGGPAQVRKLAAKWASISD